MEQDGQRPDTLQQPTNGRLRPSEEQLRMLFDSVREYAIFSVTTENIVDSWNAGAERLLGYRDQEILGQPGAIIFTPEDRRRGAVEQEVHQALTTGRAEDERWHVRKDGSRFYASGMMMALCDTAGNVRGCVKVLRDMTAHKVAEDALLASEERLRLVVDSVQDYAILTLDSVGCVTSWNTGAQRLLGYTVEEIIGRSFHCFYTAEDLALGKPAHELQVARTTGCSEDESWRVRKDGSRFWCDEIVRPLQTAEGTEPGFVNVCRDLTERKQTEEALQRAHDLLEDRVRERTAELVAANTALHAEIEARIRVEQARAAVVRSLVTAQEDERRRIARELHDQLGQNITALALALASLKTHLQIGTPQWDMVIQAEQLVAQLDDDADRLALELRPSRVEELGLLAAVQQHIEEWSAHHQIVAEVESIGWGWERFGAEMETVLYRVIQEALTNVAKHAQAEHVSIILEQRGNTVHLTIEDDGQGFDFEAVQHRPDTHHLMGLLGMRERIGLVGGMFSIETTPGRGTTLLVHIPLPAGMHEATRGQ
jgi:PAS domain S-box-containing protein